MLVMHIGRRDHRAVRQSAVAVHAEWAFHAEVTLLVLPGLVNLGFARSLGILD
jgi:hypothetical protein